MLGGILSHSGFSSLKLGLIGLVITVTVFGCKSFMDASHINWNIRTYLLLLCKYLQPTYAIACVTFLSVV